MSDSARFVPDVISALTPSRGLVPTDRLEPRLLLPSHSSFAETEVCVPLHPCSQGGDQRGL